MRSTWSPLAILLVCSVLIGCRAQEPLVKREMVPMRDGTLLATAIAFPPGDGPWPVVLSRTPYGKEAQAKDAPAFTRHGVVRVVQDLRGRFDSEGLDGIFLSDGWGEQQDGYDTIQWLAKQPWCDGKVGMIGGSAVGITQYMAAGTNPPALKCCLPTVAASSLYHHAAFPGGVFRKADVEGWTRGSGFRPEALQTVRDHPLYDGLWRTLDLPARAPQVNVPMLHVGGWYDLFSQGTLDAYMALQHQGGPGAAGKQMLVMGPWVHGTKPGDGLNYPPSARENPSGRLLGPWFLKWLLEREDPALSGPPVHYYVMGACDEPGAPGNEWRTAADWPVPSQPTPLYLHKSGNASFAPPQEEDAGLSYSYDPQDPVPTLGGSNLVLDSGPRDQRPVEERPDVLLFTTEPLAEPLEVTGRIVVRLFVHSDCPDTDFTAKISDVYPDGRSMLLTDGILRMRFRDGFQAEEAMEPQQAYAIAVDLWSTSIVFNKGHRIRIAISSSNSPRYEPNLNTGGGANADTVHRVARNTLHVGEKCPSQVILPVVQASTIIGST